MNEPFADFAEKIFICPQCGEYESFENLPQILRTKKFSGFQKKHEHKVEPIKVNEEHFPRIL